MGAAFFQYLTVVHKGAGQVGQVLFAKERQGQLSKPLGQPQAALAAFHIGGKKRVIVLKPGGEEDGGKAGHAAGHIQAGVLTGHAAGHQVGHQPVQKPGGKHKGNVL